MMVMMKMKIMKMMVMMKVIIMKMMMVDDEGKGNNNGDGSDDGNDAENNDGGGDDGEDGDDDDDGDTDIGDLCLQFDLLPVSPLSVDREQVRTTGIICSTPSFYSWRN